MKFSKFTPDCAAYILRRERRELPAEVVAQIAVDEGLYHSTSTNREDAIYSLANTLHDAATRRQKGRPDAEKVFYRTKGPHPATGRMVYQYALTEWKSAPTSREDWGPAASSALPAQITVVLDKVTERAVSLLLGSGACATAAEALMLLASWGTASHSKELKNIEAALERLRSTRDAVKSPESGTTA